MACRLFSDKSLLNNADLLSIRSQAIYFNAGLFEIQKFSFKKINFEMSSAKWRPFCLEINELTYEKPLPLA